MQHNCKWHKPSTWKSKSLAWNTTKGANISENVSVMHKNQMQWNKAKLLFGSRDYIQIRSIKLPNDRYYLLTLCRMQTFLQTSLFLWQKTYLLSPLGYKPSTCSILPVCFHCAASQNNSCRVSFDFPHLSVVYSLSSAKARKFQLLAQNGFLLWRL